MKRLEAVFLSTFALALVGAGTTAAADGSYGPWQSTYQAPITACLARLAADLGFADQAHLAARRPAGARRDCVAVAGAARYQVAELACYDLAGSEQANETPRLTQVESSSSVATSSESTRSQPGISRPRISIGRAFEPPTSASDSAGSTRTRRPPAHSPPLPCSRAPGKRGRRTSSSR